MAKSNRIANNGTRTNAKKKNATADVDTALLTTMEEAFRGIATDPKTPSRTAKNGSNRIGNVAIPPQLGPTTRLDRFDMPYGHGVDPSKRKWPEPRQLHAREALKDLTDVNGFLLSTTDCTRHMDQLLHLLANGHVQFNQLVDQHEHFLNVLEAANYEEAASNIDALELSQFIDTIKKRSQIVLDRDKYLPERVPITKDNFLNRTPEEHLLAIHTYFAEACNNLSRDFLRVIADGVDQSMIGGERSKYALIEIDERLATGRFYYWRTAVQGKTTIGTKETNRNGLKQVDTTSTNTITHQRIREEHCITEVEKFSYADAIATPQLAIPGPIELAMREAPRCLRPFLGVVAGKMRIQHIAVQDLKQKKTTKVINTDYYVGSREVSEQEYDQQVRRYDSLDVYEPALTLFGNWVLAGWNPADMYHELRRRGQIRIRDLRVREIEAERQQARERYQAALSFIAAGNGRTLVSAAITFAIMLLLSAAFFFINAKPDTAVRLAGFAITIGAICPFPYFATVVKEKLAAKRQLQNELKQLDAEETRMVHESATLRTAPLSELK